MKTTVRRFIEYFAFEAVLSAIFALLFNFIVPSYMIAVIIVTVLMLIAYIVLHTLMLRMCCFGLADMRKYFLCNMAAYLCFVIISFVCLAILPSNIYTWLFGLTKVFRYMGYRISSGASLLLFHIIMILLIALAPINMPPPPPPSEKE